MFSEAVIVSDIVLSNETATESEVINASLIVVAEGGTSILSIAVIVSLTTTLTSIR